MAPKIPRGFGVPQSKGDDDTSHRARPIKKVAHETVPTFSKHDLSKKDGKRPIENLLDHTPTKKSKVQGAPSAHVANLFGPIAAAFVGENEVHKWQSLTPENQDLAIIKASAQLLVQSIERAQRHQEEHLAIDKLKAENKKLTGMVVESDNKWKKALDIKEADLAAVRGQLEGASKQKDDLAVSLDKLQKEKEEMQLRIDSLEIEKAEAWASKRREIDDAGFQKGFDFFLTGFLAHEPDYDWSKWGEGPAEDVALFKVEHAEEIRRRRISLGYEKAVEDAPSAEDAPINNESILDFAEVQSSVPPHEQASVTEVLPPSNQDAS